MGGDGVGGKLCRAHDLDLRLGERRSGREAGAGVVGDDRVGLADDRGVRDVAVVGIIELVVVGAVLGRFDRRAWERLG